MFGLIGRLTLSTTCSRLATKSRPLFTTNYTCAKSFSNTNHFNPNAAIRASLFCRPAFLNIIKSPQVFRGSGTIAVRLASDTKIAQKAIGFWLMGCGAMVFVAVVLGGVTRLTESGLSMVTWKLLGERMPTTEEEWMAEFKKYQEYPEFKIKNREITLSEFKRIWHMEYGHRMWGRAIGVFFLIPATFFWARGWLKPAMKKRLLVFGGLIGAQGLMGWYMVKSGLEDRFNDVNDVPRVSQYRLAAHLGLALFLYASFLYSALHHLLPAETMEFWSFGQKLAKRQVRQFRRLTYACKGMIFLTALSGAFVAGLDAGLVYNSFPKMGDDWIPSDVLALSPPLSNFTENPTTVQLDHRILGTATLALVTAVWFVSRRRQLPKRAHLAANVLCAMAWLQVGLGITTLLTYVPISMAACHQSGSLLLLSSAMWLAHELKRVPK